MYYRRTKTKYGNKRCTYKGSPYDSRAEGGHAMHLDALRKAADPRERVVEWERQYKVRIEIPQPLSECPHCKAALVHPKKLLRTHRVDFLVTFADEHRELHEVKGVETRDWQIIRDALLLTFGYEHQDIEYVVIPVGRNYRPKRRARR